MTTPKGVARSCELCHLLSFCSCLFCRLSGKTFEPFYVFFVIVTSSSSFRLPTDIRVALVILMECPLSLLHCLQFYNHSIWLEFQASEFLSTPRIYIK